MIINSTSFGSITIDNKIYHHDVWIFADRLSSHQGKTNLEKMRGVAEHFDKTIQKRDKNHNFTLEEFNILAKQNPKIIIIGTGQYGVVKISKEVIKAAKERNIELIYDETPSVIKKFNELKDKKVAAAFHTTC